MLVRCLLSSSSETDAANRPAFQRWHSAISAVHDVKTHCPPPTTIAIALASRQFTWHQHWALMSITTSVPLRRPELRRLSRPVPLFHQRRSDMVPRRPASAEPLPARRQLPHARRPRRDDGPRPRRRRRQTPACPTPTPPPYQIDANTAVENAIADRKRKMLQAMATGTGKTFTTVNQTHRPMKSGGACWSELRRKGRRRRSQKRTSTTGGFEWDLIPHELTRS